MFEPNSSGVLTCLWPLIVRGAVDTDGEGFHAPVHTRSETGHQCGIYAAANKAPDWHVRHKLIPHGRSHQLIEFKVAVQNWGGRDNLVARQLVISPMYFLDSKVKRNDFARHDLPDILINGFRTRHIAELKEIAHSASIDRNVRLAAAMNDLIELRRKQDIVSTGGIKQRFDAGKVPHKRKSPCHVVVSGDRKHAVQL